MNIEVTVVDDSDYVGWLASASRVGEIYMTSVVSMVAAVRKAAGPNKILRLNILDHGNPDGIQIGMNWITLANLAAYTAELVKLKPLLHPNAIIHLQHCKIGRNKRLLQALAKLFARPVYAGTGNHNPLLRFNFGDYSRADPDGTFHTDVGRPTVFNVAGWQALEKAFQSGPGEAPAGSREM